jgi:DNA repair protein RadC
VVNHLTARLKAALEMIDIRVIDYIAIGETMHTRIAAFAGWIAIDL